MKVQLRRVVEEGKIIGVEMVNKEKKLVYLGRGDNYASERGRLIGGSEEIVIGKDYFEEFYTIYKEPGIRPETKEKKINPLVKKIKNQIRAQGIDLDF